MNKEFVVNTGDGCELPDTCLLCGSKRLAVTAIFQPPDEVGHYHYSLCAICFTLPTEKRTALVEARIYSIKNRHVH